MSIYPPKQASKPTKKVSESLSQVKSSGSNSVANNPNIAASNQIKKRSKKDAKPMSDTESPASDSVTRDPVIATSKQTPKRSKKDKKPKSERESKPVANDPVTSALQQTPRRSKKIDNPVSKIESHPSRSSSSAIEAVSVDQKQTKKRSKKNAKPVSNTVSSASISVSKDSIIAPSIQITKNSQKIEIPLPRIDSSDEKSTASGPEPANTPLQLTTKLSKKFAKIIPQIVSTDKESATYETVISPHSSPVLLPKSHAVRRYLGWAASGMVFLLICVPIVLWIHYQSVNVMSRNAMVRGNLAELGTRLNGVLSSVEVAEGERVVKGQVLARLEDRHIRSAALEVQAEIEGLEQELEVEHMAIIHKQRSLDNKLLEAVANQKAAEAEVTAAKSRADNARQSYEMRKSLLSNNAISREVVRDAGAKRRTEQAMVNVAKANHTAARSVEAAVRLETDGLDIRKQRIGIIKAKVLRAKARLERVKADLDSSLIRAPDNGAVVRWLVQLGGSIKVGIPLVSMWLGKDVWIEAWIDEDEISKVKIGSEATVTLQSFPGREFSAVVDKIGLTTDFQMPASYDIIPQPRFTRLRGAPVVGVLVRLLNPPQDLLPGLSAIVAIHNVKS